MTESDRTIFRQPLPGGDKTLFRGSPSQRASSTSLRGSHDYPQNIQRASSQPISRQSASEMISFDSTNAINPVVGAAQKLISIFSKIRVTSQHKDIASLHQRLIHEIKEFEEKLRDHNCRQEIILAARYLMCSVIDESVLNTPWGTESPWAQRTLLSIFHGETSGGEKSFLLLEKLCQSPSENLDFIELFYIFLSLGFEGKYRFSPRGKDSLQNLRDEMFSLIRRYRGDQDRSISISWQGLRTNKKRLSDSIPMWLVALSMATILFFVYSAMKYWLYISATPIVNNISEIIQNSVN